MRMKSYPLLFIPLLAASFSLFTAAAQGQGFTGVFTQHNDTARTGQNLNGNCSSPRRT